MSPSPAGEERGPRRGFRRDRDLLIVLLAAFLVYAPAFWWGAPHAVGPSAVDSWGVDVETPLGPLAEIHNIIEPKPDRNLGYPLFYSFLTAAAYSPYMAWLVATGGLRDPGGTYPFGFQDPVTALRNLSWIAHLVTVLLAVVMAGALFVAARVRWDRATGFVAAALGGLAYPMVYYARTGNVDGAMLALTALTVAAYAHCLVHGFTVRGAVWLGVFAGLALATKEAALGALLAMPLGLLAAPRSTGRGGLVRPAAAGMVAALLALGIGSGFFVEPSRYIAHLQFLTGRLGELASGQSLPITFDRSLQGSAAMLLAMGERLVEAMTLPGLVLAIAGAAWLVHQRRPGLALLLPAVSYAAYMFFVLRAVQLRYVLPFAVLLCFAASPLVVAGWRARRPALRAAVGLLAGVTLGLQLLRAADLTQAMLRDSRYEAGEWLRANLETGDGIAFFGPRQKLPPLPPGFEPTRAAPYFGMYAPPVADAATILAGWEESPPRFVIVVPDHTSHGLEHSHTLPPDLYGRLLAGDAGYRLVHSARTPPLLPWVRRPPLDYPTVNPPIRIFERLAPEGSAALTGG